MERPSVLPPREDMREWLGDYTIDRATGSAGRGSLCGAQILPVGTLLSSHRQRRRRGLVRKPIGCSKSLTMHEVVIDLVINRYEFGLPVELMKSRSVTPPIT
jgi:hypothetical protein